LSSTGSVREHKQCIQRSVSRGRIVNVVRQ
jgi:hypothetical protein